MKWKKPFGPNARHMKETNKGKLFLKKEVAKTVTFFYFK
jgi:hypothetical protein